MLAFRGKCCHKLALNLGFLVDSLFPGNFYKARAENYAFARRKACGRNGGKLHSFLTSVIAEVAASPP
jgi:hypothetical protein